MGTGPQHVSRCPVCGTTCVLHTADEGTSHYEPLRNRDDLVITDDAVSRARIAWNGAMANNQSAEDSMRAALAAALATG